METNENVLINKVEDFNIGNTIKSGDQTLLKYKILDGDGEILDLAGSPCRAVVKKHGREVYSTTDVTIAADNVAQFRITEVLPADEKKPYMVEFIINEDDKPQIFPSKDTIELYILSSSILEEKAIIQSAGCKTAEEIILKKANPILDGIDEAEATRRTSEDTRVTNELAREQSEEDRKFEEMLRQLSEADRGYGESTRVAAESNRKATFDELVDTGVFQTNINTKLSNLEQTYAPKLAELDNNEDARKTAESARETNEAERILNEDGRVAAENERQTNYNELVDTGVIQENINQKLSESEQTYAPRLTNLEQNDAELTAQLAQKAQQLEQLGISKADKSDIDDFNSRIDQIITTPTDSISQQEIVDARQNKASLGENLMTLKDNLKTVLEPTGKDNIEYVLKSGRFGSSGYPYSDRTFVRYVEYFGGYGVNGVIRNTNPIEYSFDVIFYDQAQNFIKRDRGVTSSKYVVDEKYLFRVAISRADGANIVESDMSTIHDTFFISDRLDITGNITGNISGNIMLGKDSVKLENMADKPRIIYPYQRSSLVIEQEKGVAVYFYASNIMVRNHSGNITFNQSSMRDLLRDYVSDSPSGGTNYIRIPEKKSLVYDVPEKTLKVVEWQEIKTTQDLLLLSNHDDLMGVLADYWKWSILEDTSNKVGSSITDETPVNIPNYWNSHINEKINQIRSSQLSLGKDGFSFGFITDIHYNPRNTGYKVSSPYIMSKVMKDCSVKFFVNGGDIGNQQNGENGREVIISDYYELLGKFKNAGIIDKMLPLIGNHESNTQNWKVGEGAFANVMVDNDEIYSILFRDTERIPSISYGGDGTYYYVDDIPNQVRYVCLNTNDVEYTESIRIDFAIKQQQFDWLINEALELPNADWSVILATHIPPVTQDFDHRGMPVKNMEILKGIIRAFKDKSQFSDSENHSNSIYNASVSVDFTDNENEFIVWIAGHHHRDHVTLVDNSYTVVLTADDGRRNSDNPIKTIGTDTEHVMDFFTVDKISKKVFITRVGAGEDREFTY